MFSLVIARIQRYFQQYSSITHVHHFLSRAIGLLVRLARRFSNSRSEGDEEKGSVMAYEVHSLRPAGEYICASQLPRSLTPETRPSEPCSPSDTPYDAPARLVIPPPARKQTSHDLMSSPEHLTVPAPPEVREAPPNRVPHPTSPTVATRPPISVNTKFNSRFVIGYPDTPPTRTPVSPDTSDYIQRPTLARAATFGGSSDDPLFATRSFLSPRRHTLAVPTSPENNDPITRPGSAQSNVSLGRNQSNMSLGRNSYRKHDGQAPRPRSPTPSIYEGSSNMCGVSSATLAAALAQSETDGSQVPFAPRPSSSDHAYSRETTSGPRLAPMSANGVKRFDRHSREFAMMYASCVANIA